MWRAGEIHHRAAFPALFAAVRRPPPPSHTVFCPPSPVLPQSPVAPVPPPTSSSRPLLRARPPFSHLWASNSGPICHSPSVPFPLCLPVHSTLFPLPHTTTLPGQLRHPSLSHHIDLSLLSSSTCHCQRILLSSLSASQGSRCRLSFAVRFSPPPDAAWRSCSARNGDGQATIHNSDLSSSRWLSACSHLYHPPLLRFEAPER